VWGLILSVELFIALAGLPLCRRRIPVIDGNDSLFIGTVGSGCAGFISTTVIVGSSRLA